MASPEVIWQQHNSVGAVYCHMLVFHSEHSLLSRMCFCFPGEHIFRPLTGTDTTVFSITPQTFICSCIIRKVYVKGHASALIKDGLFTLSLCREDQTQPSAAVLRLLQRSNMASCTAPFHYRQSDRWRSIAPPHPQSPILPCPQLDQFIEIIIMKHDSWEWD